MPPRIRAGAVLALSSAECFPHGPQGEVVAMVDTGVAWLRQEWPRMSARYGGGAPADWLAEDELLHFNFPGLLVRPFLARRAWSWR